jgi:hypothetical protein
MWNFTGSRASTKLVDYSADEQKIFDATKRIVPFILVGGAIGFIALLLWTIGAARYGYPGEADAAVLRLFGVYFLVGCAALATGALFGFLFAIPRTREAAVVAAQGAAQGADPLAVRQAVLSANTNLERVSDWLTTLLLGATLVQLRPIVDWVAGLGDNIENNPEQAITTVVVIYFLVLGFLGTYLVTRLYLTYALERTLYMLSGGAPAVDATRKALEDAVAARDNKQIDDALAAFRQKTDPAIRNDPSLNLLAARAASQRLKAGGLADDERQKLEATLLESLGKAKPKLQAERAASADFQQHAEALQGRINAALTSRRTPRHRLPPGVHKGRDGPGPPQYRAPRHQAAAAGREEWSSATSR